MRHLLGIGCQRLAFNRLGIEVEMVGISEIDKYALQSYMAIHGDTKNFGSICDIQSLPEVDVFTWSFPCTDLSKAGKQKGLTNTRSGLVYEVLRILHNTEHKPKVLIMENVVDLVQTKFIREFQSIQHELELMGYTNHTETMNSKDYGVAQNRDRVFMVSILGEYYYEFPKSFPLEKRLKDYLEESVDEKYYLSEKTVNVMLNRNESNQEKGNGFKFEPRTGDDIGRAILTMPGSRSDDNFIKESVRLGGLYDDENGRHQAGSIWDVNGLSPTIDTAQGGHRQPFVVEPIICASRGRNADNPKSRESGLSTVQMIEPKYDGTANTLTTVQKDNLVMEHMRIRKLTPLECWRLMGINDKDFRAAEKVCSNSQLYKQAGNGIVVDVFAKIIEQMKEENI